MNRCLFICCFLAAVSMSGCAKVPESYRMSSGFASGSSSIRSLAVAPPDIEIFELTTTGEGSITDRAKGLSRGFRLPRPDVKETATRQVNRSLHARLNDKGISTRILKRTDTKQDQELRDIQALYRTISVSIRLHTYPNRAAEEELSFIKALFLSPDTETPPELFKPFLFPDKTTHFDYSVGAIHDVLGKSGEEALLLVGGFDETSSLERRGLMTMGMAVNTALGSKLPTSIPGLPEAGRTAVSAAIIDHSGTILWYTVKGSAIDDLTSPVLTDMLMKGIINDLPEGVVRP